MHRGTHSYRSARWGRIALAAAALALVLAPAAFADHGEGGGDASLTGAINALPSTTGWVGDWTVGTTIVHVTASTEINQDDGAVAVGAVVKVEGALQPDGSIDAASIEVKKPAGGAPAEVEMSGVISALPSGGLIGDWTVGGETVHVSAATEINQEDGAAAVGAVAHVQGTLLADKSIDAKEIEIKPSGPPSGSIEFVGVVASLPATTDFTGDWVVDSITVHVSTATTIDQSKGAVAVGALVQVEGMKQADGSVNAAAIKVLPGPKPPTDTGTHVFAVLKLTPTAAAPADAEGQVVTRHFVFPDGTIREDIKVTVEGLLPGTAYDVTIDTVMAGTIMTDGEGEGQLFLSTQNLPGAEPLPTSLQPVTKLKQISIADPSAVVMFTGDFANARINSGEGEGNAFTSIAPLKNVSGTVVGVASAAIRGNEQFLFVGAFGFTPGATVHIVVDGTDLGAFTIGPSGELKANFGSNPEDEERQLPPALLPVSGLLHIEIQDTGGAVLASGDFTIVTDGGGHARAVVGSLRRHFHH